jgi:CelD/BcsL family acetyltransferase involved in cellulose biosynthesis
MAWWHAFGRGTLRVLTVRTGERLTGILPVVRDGPVLRSPTNSHTQLFGFLTEDEDSARRLAVSLLTTSARRLDLSLLSSEDSGFRCLREEARVRRFRTITRPVLLSPYVSTQGEWSSYQATLEAKLQREIRRRLRRLQELGEVHLEVADGPERLETLLLEGFRVEESGWKGAYGTAINSNPRRRRFYREVARWATERGWLRLAFLRLDGRPIAFDLCLETGGVHYLLKTGYDHDFHKFGPGLILRSMMLQRAFAGPIDTYELLGTIVGAKNRWKLDWTRQHRELLKFQAFAPSLAGGAEWSAFNYGPVVSHGARVLAGRALGPSGRNLVKRGRRLLRKLIHT